MRTLLRTTLLIFIVVGGNLRAQDASAVWTAISQPAFDPAKYATVENVEIVRDRIHITLEQGTIQFTQPAAGMVFGAAFDGRGRVQIDPPNALEAQQVRRFTGQDKLDMEFTSATFTFTDDTFAKILQDLRWTQAPNDKLASLYQGRQNDRENIGTELLPRLLQGILSSDHQRTGLFFADLKTSDKGWVQTVSDALDPESIMVGRYDDWGGAMAFDTWLHFPTGNRSSADVFRDPLALADFEVHSYQIDGAVTAGAEFSATSRVHLTQHYTGERILRFELDSNLRVDSVKDETGAPLPFYQARERKDRNNSYGEYVAVLLPQPTQAAKEQTLEFHYGGKRVVRRVGEGNYFCQSERWYPEGEDPSGTAFAARSNFEMTFHAPKKFTLVATGTRVAESSDGKVTTTTWKSDKPLTVAGFAMGDYKVVSADAGGVNVEVYANKQPDDRLAGIQQAVDQSNVSIGSLSPEVMAKQMNTEVGNAIRVFQQFYGPAPYSRIAVTNIMYSYGQGWPMLLYLSSLSFLDPTQRHMLGITAGEDVELSDFFRAHEVSHQWWGHRVAWKSYHDQWLSEGFAQFSGNLYVQFRRSWKDYLERLQVDRTDLKDPDLKSHTLESAGPIWMGERLASADSERAYDVDVYDKGGLVLNMLRMMLFDPQAKDPDTGFKTMMQDFTQTFDGKAASTEDFKAIAEKHMTPIMDLDGNHKLDWFFNQYVYGTGIPHYTFSSKVTDAGNGKSTVSTSVVRSGVPDGWKDILPLYMHVSGRVLRSGWMLVRQDTTSFQADLPVKPDKISINDNEDILADVKQ